MVFYNRFLKTRILFGNSVKVNQGIPLKYTKYEDTNKPPGIWYGEKQIKLQVIVKHFIEHTIVIYKLEISISYINYI